MHKEAVNREKKKSQPRKVSITNHLFAALFSKEHSTLLFSSFCQADSCRFIRTVLKNNCDEEK